MLAILRFAALASSCLNLWRLFGCAGVQRFLTVLRQRSSLGYLFLSSALADAKQAFQRLVRRILAFLSPIFRRAASNRIAAAVRWPSLYGPSWPHPRISQGQSFHGQPKRWDQSSSRRPVLLSLLDWILRIQKTWEAFLVRAPLAFTINWLLCWEGCPLFLWSWVTPFLTK